MVVRQSTSCSGQKKMVAQKSTIFTSQKWERGVAIRELFQPKMRTRRGNQGMASTESESTVWQSGNGVGRRWEHSVAITIVLAKMKQQRGAITMVPAKMSIWKPYENILATRQAAATCNKCGSLITISIGRDDCWPEDNGESKKNMEHHLKKTRKGIHEWDYCD